MFDAVKKTATSSTATDRILGNHVLIKVNSLNDYVPCSPDLLFFIPTGTLIETGSFIG